MLVSQKSTDRRRTLCKSEGGATEDNVRAVQHVHVKEKSNRLQFQASRRKVFGFLLTCVFVSAGAV